MAISAAVKPLIIDPRFAILDLPVVLAVTAVFSIFLLFVGRIGKVAGVVMVLSYLIFTVAQYGGLAEYLAGSGTP
jgi:cation:H+ antiporter